MSKEIEGLCCAWCGDMFPLAEMATEDFCEACFHVADLDGDDE